MIVLQEEVEASAVAGEDEVKIMANPVVLRMKDIYKSPPFNLFTQFFHSVAFKIGPVAIIR